MAKASGFITLTTDFGLADGFVGTMKGVIYTINPDATIIDISHEIGSRDVSEAAFLLEASYKYFPRGTVHLVVVDPGVGSRRRATAVETEGYYFVAPDNGVLTRALVREKVIKSVELTNSAYFLNEVSDTFHGRDIFAPAAAHLSLGTAIEALDIEIDGLIEMPVSEPEVSQKGIRGRIIHIDKFGNLITDIPRRLFEAAISDRQFVIELAGIKLDRLSRSYADAPAGEPLAIFDSFDNLEIAVNHANAAKVLGVQIGDDIQIAVRECPA
jgi:S-adenosylmethionine hydrolase